MIEVIKILIERGANLEVKKYFHGYTPLIAACRRANHYSDWGSDEDEDWSNQVPDYEHENIEVIKLLILEGANTGTKDSDGKTFYDYLDNKTKKDIDLFIKYVGERGMNIKG